MPRRRDCGTALQYSTFLSSTSTPPSTSSSLRAAMGSAVNFNVSLEPHLVDTLRPLVPVLPDTLSKELSATLASAAKSSTPSSPTAAGTVTEVGDNTASAPPLIPYSLLSSISTWTRSSDGRDALTRCSPSLEPKDYTMVALLAGTRTSPEKKFPNTPVKPEASEKARQELNDRRAVTAVLNALLSVIGSGAATWWAADKLSWKQEWVSCCGVSFWCPDLSYLTLPFISYG